MNEDPRNKKMQDKVGEGMKKKKEKKQGIKKRKEIGVEGKRGDVLEQGSEARGGGGRGERRKTKMISRAHGVSMRWRNTCAGEGERD